MMDTVQAIRALMDAMKKQADKDSDKGVFKHRSTIRHLEAEEDGTVTGMLTSLPNYAKEAE